MTPRGGGGEPRPPGLSGPSVLLRPALAVIAGSAVLVCAVEIALLRYPAPDVLWVNATLSLAGLVSVLAGVLAWDRRPSNHMGLWLVLFGYLDLVARLSDVADPVLSTVGALLAQAPIAAVLHLMLVFPSGRLQGRLDRSLVSAGYAVLVVMAVPITLFRADDPSGALRVEPRPDVVETALHIEQLAWLGILLVALVVLVGRLRRQRAVAGERRARALVYAAGIASIVMIPLLPLVGRAVGWSVIVVFLCQVALLALLPLVFVGSLLVGGYARTGRLEELAAWLGATSPERPSLVRALSETLGDESLELLYTAPGSPGFVDHQGRLVGEPEVRSPSAAVPVHARGQQTALIVYDTAAVPDRRLVESAGQVVALALDRERLTFELLAEREAVQQSRARIVQVGDTERRRLAADLHDVLQSRLVLAAMQAGSLAVDARAPAPVQASADALRADLDQLVDELRRLVHGVLPALLLERGLQAAAKDLVDRCRIPNSLTLTPHAPALPPVVSTHAYLVLAEAVTNAVKHSGASQLDVAIEIDTHEVRLRIRDDGIGGAAPTGAGLRGMADRVEALGGTLHVVSRPRSGTTVVATIPAGEPRSGR